MKRINIFSVKQVREKGGLYNLDSTTIGGPKDAVHIIKEVFRLEEEPVEKVIVMTLNTKNALAGLHVISIGTLNSSLVHPREVFMAAILNNASSLILVHNHPSGDPTPSSDDIAVMKRIRDAGKILGIEMVDSLVIGEGERFVSFREKGLI